MAADNPADAPADAADPGLTFRSTSGAVLGALGAAGCSVGAVSAVVAGDEPSWAAGWGLLLAAVVSLAVLVRPRLVADPDRLTIVGVVRTTSLPWVSIETVVVRQVLVLRAAGRRHTSAAVSRSRRQLYRADRAVGSGRSDGAPRGVDLAGMGVGELAEHTVRTRAEDARQRAGLRRGETPGAGGEPRVRVDWPWVAALTVPALGLGVALLV